MDLLPQPFDIDQLLLQITHAPSQEEAKALIVEYGRLKVQQYKAWLDATFNDGYYYHTYLEIPMGVPDAFDALEEYGRLKVQQYKAWLEAEYQQEFAGSLEFPDEWKHYLPK